ncbi:MAG: hypothetical protein ACRDGS_09060, partial [Chloroflexota bacterium]
METVKRGRDTSKPVVGDSDIQAQAPGEIPEPYRAELAALRQELAALRARVERSEGSRPAPRSIGARVFQAGAVGAAVLLLVGTNAFAAGPPAPSQIRACYAKNTGALSIVTGHTGCGAGKVALVWNTRGG